MEFTRQMVAPIELVPTSDLLAAAEAGFRNSYEEDPPSYVLTEQQQHYAFLVSEAEFDEIFQRIRERSLSYWADPYRQKESEINTGMAAEACIGTTPADIFWKSSLDRTEAQARRQPIHTLCWREKKRESE